MTEVEKAGRPLTRDESTIARIAGNVAAGMVSPDLRLYPQQIGINELAATSVEIARAIVREITS